MNLILAFLVRHLSGIWAYGFQIEKSVASSSNGGDALLNLSSENLRISFVCDRRQVSMEFCPADSKATFSIDLIRRLFLDEREMSAVLDDGYGSFLSSNLREIVELFDPSRVEVTVTKLEALKRVRAKEMFG
jgi:hypothetical protein